MEFTREERIKFFQNEVKPKEGFNFKHIIDFKDEINMVIKQIDFKKLDWESRINVSTTADKYDDELKEVVNYTLIQTINRHQYEEPYKTVFVKNDIKLLNLIEPILEKLEELYDGKITLAMFVKLPAGKIVKSHSDSQGYFSTGQLGSAYYHYLIHRIHIPIITNDEVYFRVNEEVQHMEVGECWEFNSDYTHDTWNAGKEDRIHLHLNVMTEKWL